MSYCHRRRVKKCRTLIETLNKKEVDKIMGAFLLKGRYDGFASLSFPVVPSISPPPQWAFIYLLVWLRNTHQKERKAFHHQDLSLPNINKVYTPDRNVPLLLIVFTAVEKRRGQNGRQAVDQRPHEFVCVVWHSEWLYKSPGFSHPVSTPLRRHFQVLPTEKMNLGVLFLVVIHEMKPFKLTLPPKTLGALITRRDTSGARSLSASKLMHGADQRNRSLFEKSSFVRKKGRNFAQSHEVQEVKEMMEQLSKKIRFVSTLLLELGLYTATSLYLSLP